MRVAGLPPVANQHDVFIESTLHQNIHSVRGGRHWSALSRLRRCLGSLGPCIRLSFGCCRHRCGHIEGLSIGQELVQRLQVADNVLATFVLRHQLHVRRAVQAHHQADLFALALDGQGAAQSFAGNFTRHTGKGIVFHRFCVCFVHQRARHRPGVRRGEAERQRK